jgi:hypothetical protein
MGTYTIGSRRYRVTNKTKFIFSTLFILAIISTALFYVSATVIDYVSAINKQKAYERQQQELKVLKEKYSFTVADINIEATSADEALGKLISEIKIILDEKNGIINQQQETIEALEEKYAMDIIQVKEVTKKDVQIYNEFSYAIEYPGSDMTLDDIKMIIQICEEEGVNPHLWLSLVELESGYKSTARSNKSTASGWGQVLRDTGEFLYEKSLNLGKYNHSRMSIDKEINARMSIHYLAMLIKEKGSVEQALISYNGNELGQRYVSIVSSNLKKNSGLTLSSINKDREI